MPLDLMIHLIKSAAQKMLIDFEDTRGISHNPTKGRAREFIVLEQFLRKYLPPRYAISSGLIVDAALRESRQQDLMIYDAFGSPVLLDMESDKIVFPEAVFATLEVKSKLTDREVRDVVAKAADVGALTKSEAAVTFLTPGVGQRAAHPPILAAAVCFESSMELEELVPKLRAARGEVAGGHWLSMVLVLKDKAGAAGLVVNADERDVRRVLLIPTERSRLMLVRAEDAGDALLYFYLHLMNHLRLCGLAMPGPNLAQYVDAAGLGKVEHTMGREEAKGAALGFGGGHVELDAADRMRELTARVFEEETATDEEILELLVLSAEMPVQHGLLDPHTAFRLSRPGDPPGAGEPQRFARPRDVVLAAHRKLRGEAMAGDGATLREYISLVRRLKAENLALIVVDEAPPRPSVQYVFVPK